MSGLFGLSLVAELEALLTEGVLWLSAELGLPAVNGLAMRMLLGTLLPSVALYAIEKRVRRSFVQGHKEGCLPGETHWQPEGSFGSMFHEAACVAGYKKVC